MRGHRGNTKNHPEVGKSGLTNSGNFVELLMYSVREGIKILENLLQNAPQNAKYTSPDVQNELIEGSRNLTMEQLCRQKNNIKAELVSFLECSYELNGQS